MTRALLLASLLCACSGQADGGANDLATADAALDGQQVEGGSPSDAGGTFDLGAPTEASPPSDASCVAVETAATIVKRPIDFIVLPDESGSMGSTRDAVANAMQKEVKAALDAAAIDYAIVWHGAWPLPALAGKVTYNKVALGSGSSVMFKPVLDTFAAWSPALREPALKVFIQFTDAASGDGGGITGYAGAFDDALIAKSSALFGTASARKFSHHVFIGITPKSPADAPWQPAEAVVGKTCGGGYNAAVPLEELARRNGGYRFPLCRPDLFAGVFDRIAKTAIELVSAPCELVIPEPPGGTKLVFSTVAVRLKAGDGKEELFLRAKDPSECADNRFLLDEATRRVSLCPTACARVKADPKATLKVLSGCDPKLY